MGNFREDIETGKIGEKKTLDFLNSLDMTYRVEDVTEDELWQKLDVDFLQIVKDGEIYRIEVKTDTIAHKSGNIVYEHTSNIKYNTKGCFEKTKSDIMFYYLSEVDELYYINIYELRKYVNESKKTLTEVNMGDFARGYLLRLNKLLELEIMFKAK